MGQAASLEHQRKRTPPHRARAQTMKLNSPSFTALKASRLSLPDAQYTLTQYDVKQLMKSYHEAMERGDTHTTSSAESEVEDELMDQIHGQFGSQPRTRSMLQSTTSNASEDSGIDENSHSTRHSLDDLTSLPVFTKIDEDTPMVCTPATPVVIPVLEFTPPAEQIDLNKYILPLPKRRRFIPKRLFGKKKTVSSQRPRSKSLGTVMARSVEDQMLAQFIDKVHASTTSLASTMSGGTSCDDGSTPPPIQAGISELKASVRRLSMPLGRAKTLSQRRLSQMVTAIGEVIDQEILMTNEGDRPAPLFGSSLLNREWELVTVREMCRRLSLDEIEQLEMPIPEGASQSQILDELMIRQVSLASVFFFNRGISK
ncbi:hypothetical protein GCK32_019342 [Trichostrongylus colubriformis]|uniref:Uncharacterized protein n=1 Tax=Trichostrongylus colubriformis TaxID=6319 RepID=A0AAN8FM32_TRICO